MHLKIILVCTYVNHAATLLPVARNPDSSELVRNIKGNELLSLCNIHFIGVAKLGN